MGKKNKRKNAKQEQVSNDETHEKKIEGSKPKEELLESEGVVTEALRGKFRVQLESGHEILAHLGGKLRKHYIKIVPGDKVKVEITPYDLTRGRITYRQK